MTPTITADRRSNLGAFFRVAIQPRSYLNLVYLLAAFPLGICYFVFLVTGFSTALGTLIVWIGVPLLGLVMLAAWGMAVIERELTMAWLDIDIPPMAAPTPATASFWERIKAHLLNPTTWKSLVYLLLKFPFGVAAFVAKVTLSSIALALLLAPVWYAVGTSLARAYGWSGDGYIFSLFTGETIPVTGQFDPSALLKLLLMTPLGALAAILTLHALNLLARCWGEIARGLLGTATAA